jgi:hypothetical protein
MATDVAAAGAAAAQVLNHLATGPGDFHIE